MKVPKDLDVDKLKQKNVSAKLTERLDCLDPDSIWENLETKFILLVEMYLDIKW